MSIELEKYKGQSTRFACPKCGRKHSFTRYIDTETNIYIDEKVGICNRAINCGYHYTPKQYFESMGVHKLARISTNELNQKEISGNYSRLGFEIPSVHKFGISNPEQRLKELIPIKQIDNKYLLQTISKPSHFLTFLFDNFHKEDVERVIKDYFIGGAMDNGVVFWQIDSSFRIRTGKIMQYNPQTGKRVKNNSTPKHLNTSTTQHLNNSTPKPLTWVHSEMKKQNLLPNDWQLTQCLFGEHLLIKYPQKPIMLVESEKTSIIMSLYEPSFNWMATGGLNNLTENKIYPIRKQQITAFPDLKCFELWQSKAERINKAIGSKIELSHILEEIATKEDKELGLDLADYFLNG